MPKPLIIQILADAKGVKSGVAEAETATSGLGGKLGHLQKAAGLAGLAMGGALAVGIKSSVSAALDAQKVQTQTEAQLKALGINYSEHAKKINSVVQATSQLAAVDDEDLQQSFTRLLPATKNVNVALKDMQLVADIARARNISLESATSLVTKANTGSAGALRRLGISLVATSENTDKAKMALADYKKTHEKLTPAMKAHFDQLIANAKGADKQAQAVKNLDVLQKTFAGSAEAYGKSAAGAQDRMKVSIENLQESMGSMLLPVVSKVSNAIAAAAGFMTQHTTATKILIGVVGGLSAALIGVSTATKIAAGESAIWNAATKLAAAGQWLLNTALDANPIGIVVIAIAALAAGLVLAYKHSETFRDIVNGAFGVVKDTVNALLGAFHSVFDWIKNNWKTIAVIISGPFAPLVALATNAFGIRSALVGAVTGIKTTVGHLVDDVVGFFSSLPGRIIGYATDFGGSFVRGVSSGLSAFGSMLVNLIKNPINTIIGAIDGIKIPAFSMSIDTHIPGVGKVGFDYGGSGSLFSIPKLAAGGIVNAPTLALIGEKGPEAVVPLDRLAMAPGAGAGDTVYNVTVNLQAGNVIGGDLEQLGRDLEPTLRAALIRVATSNGTTGIR